MALIHVANWKRFQHYKGRRPPWIKLHRELLDDFDFFRLRVASRALAPCIWLLASESEDGSITLDLRVLAYRLRMPEADILDALKELVEFKLLIADADASAVLAERKHESLPEERRVEEIRGTNGNGSAPVPVAAIVRISPKSWSQEACDDWALHLGTPPGERIGKALKPLQAEHGWSKVRPIWLEACERASLQPDPSVFTPEVFGRTFKARMNAPQALMVNYQEPLAARHKTAQASAFIAGGMLPGEK